MSMNPLTLIEKTINEHGSAVILKERIELAREKYAALERKLAEAISLIGKHEATIVQLQSDNERLELELQKAANETKELKAQLTPSIDALHTNEETILKHLASCDHATIDEIAGATTIGKQTIKMHVSNLETAGLIESFDGYLSTHWRLTDDGRRRMFALGLLK